MNFSPFTGRPGAFAGKPGRQSARRRILNAMPTPDTDMIKKEEPHGTDGGPILIGLIIIFVGLAMLADRSGISAIHLSGKYWPAVLIAFGCARLLTPRVRPDGQRPSRWTGVWFIYLGLWFFVNEFHVFGFRYGSSWPLLIVGAGIGMIWRAIENPDRRECQRIEEH
jgi:hypothetical protein